MRTNGRSASTYGLPMSRQIVVSGGAGYWCGPEGAKLDEYVLSLVDTPLPRVCALFTASGDAESFVRMFYEQFERRCEVSHLSLFLPPFDDPAELLARQDVIYVGGGNTANMLAVWRVHGVDRLLRDALDRGTILYGSSAGGICWFDSGLTDSLSFDGSLHPLGNGLGFIAGSHAPHFDRSGRAQTYMFEVAEGRLAGGIGVDDFAAVHFIDGGIHRIVATRTDATAYLVAPAADIQATATRLPATIL